MTYTEWWRSLTAVYDEGEAQAVAQMVLEVGFGLTLADALCGGMPDEALLVPVRERLLAGEPVQYVLAEAEFGPYRLHVAPGVLIPRPETYELCQWVTAGGGSNLLDIGTGSGCIACALAAGLPQADVTAWDVSSDALDIARSNAVRLDVSVAFRQVDILTPQPAPDRQWDVIVSNPPYICRQESAGMERRVLDYEPDVALFVPDDDPLLFYRAIACYAAFSLTAGGRLFFEINPLYVRELEQLLHDEGFQQTQTRPDQFGRERFIKTVKP